MDKLDHYEDGTIELFEGKLVHWLYDGETLSIEPSHWCNLPTVEVYDNKFTIPIDDSYSNVYDSRDSSVCLWDSIRSSPDYSPTKPYMVSCPCPKCNVYC